MRNILPGSHSEHRWGCSKYWLLWSRNFFGGVDSGRFIQPIRTCFGTAWALLHQALVNWNLGWNFEIFFPYIQSSPQIEALALQNHVFIYFSQTNVLASTLLELWYPDLGTNLISCSIFNFYLIHFEYELIESRIFEIQGSGYHFEYQFFHIQKFWKMISKVIFESNIWIFRISTQHWYGLWTVNKVQTPNLVVGTLMASLVGRVTNVSLGDLNVCREWWRWLALRRHEWEWYWW